MVATLQLTGRKLEDVKMVVNGAGASAIACTALIKAMGVRHDNVIMCDRSGPIYPGRDKVDQWKSAHAVETDARSLEEALVGVTINAAASLNRADRVGSLEVGKQLDAVLIDGTLADLVRVGAPTLKSVIKRGLAVHQEAVLQQTSTGV